MSCFLDDDVCNANKDRARESWISVHRCPLKNEVSNTSVGIVDGQICFHRYKFNCNEMKLAESVVLKFKYESSIVLVRVSLVRGLTWEWVATEVLRLYVLSLDTEARTQLKNVRISGILSPNKEHLDLKQRLLYYDVKGMMPKVFVLLTAGPWFMLHDEQLQYMCTFLGSSDVNALIRTSKKFRKLFSTDMVWENVPYTFSGWRGDGCNGTEDSQWAKTRQEGGLTIANANRLRWMAHNTSRLRLYYGSMAEDYESAPTNFLSFLFSSARNTNIQRTILIVGASGQRTSEHTPTKRFMQQLHFIVPESSTQYHLLKTCKPLLARGMLFDVEPSPPKSRSRNHHIDPGTRIECCTEDLRFLYRRIGDPRLTFIGMDFDVDAPASDGFRLDHFYTLTDKVSLAYSSVFICFYIQLQITNRIKIIIFP